MFTTDVAITASKVSRNVDWVNSSQKQMSSLLTSNQFGKDISILGNTSKFGRVGVLKVFKN